VDDGVPLGSDASLALDVGTAAMLASLFDLRGGVDTANRPLCGWLRDVTSVF
jgi:hypothetical protein